MAKSSMYLESTREATISASALVTWWDRPLPDDLGNIGYLPFKVEIHKSDFKDGVRVLEFSVVGHQPQSGQPQQPFTLKLPLEAHYVWPDLPSTAQLAGVGQFGFLFLSQAWLSAYGVSENLAEGGGKWPIGADDSLTLAIHLARAMRDKCLRERVQGVLDDFYLSRR